ncbi:MAG: hypothetical protein DUD30_00660 [Lactobacillus sp.]|nr:MAG: hypothetical protein DUD30_00660 [Lactobacillus sp.]
MGFLDDLGNRLKDTGRYMAETASHEIRDSIVNDVDKIKYRDDDVENAYKYGMECLISALLEVGINDNRKLRAIVKEYYYQSTDEDIVQLIRDVKAVVFPFHQFQVYLMDQENYLRDEAEEYCSKNNVVNMLRRDSSLSKKSPSELYQLIEEKDKR